MRKTALRSLAGGQGGGAGGPLSHALAIGATGAHHGDTEVHRDTAGWESVSLSRVRGHISATCVR
jgi:hypothetical protein